MMKKKQIEKNIDIHVPREDRLIAITELAKAIHKVAAALCETPRITIQNCEFKNNGIRIDKENLNN